jgi:hypothetical protein
MPEPSDEPPDTPLDGPPSRPSFAKETVDRWQVFGGVAGVVALGVTVLSAAKDLVPLSLAVSVGVAFVGVFLFYRWGRSISGRNSAFVIAAVVTLVGAATAGFTAGVGVRSSTLAVNSSATKSAGRTVASESGTYWQGALTMRSGQYLDLDSSEGEKGLQETFTAGADIKYDTHILGMRSGGHMAFVSNSATYQDCATATALVESLPSEKVEDGSAFCVETTEGRWARVTVAHRRISEKPENDQIDVDVLVWSER